MTDCCFVLRLRFDTSTLRQAQCIASSVHRSSGQAATNDRLEINQMLIKVKINLSNS
jgi:hypothetical protein